MGHVLTNRDAYPLTSFHWGTYRVEALAAGYDVTALVRSLEKLSGQPKHKLDAMENVQ